MKSRRELISMWNDPRMRELIDSLWREYYGLYQERYSRSVPGDEFQKNKISKDINHGVAVGQDNVIEGNRSAAFGQGLNTKSFQELLFGSYATLGIDQDAEVWDDTDRLMVVGNGTDDEHRSNALEIFKSGLIKLYNSLVLSKYEHGTEAPEDGTLQFDEADIQVFINGFWKILLTDAPNDSKPYGRRNKAWEEVAALDHDHEIGNVALLFENQLI